MVLEKFYRPLPSARWGISKSAVNATPSLYVRQATHEDSELLSNLGASTFMSAYQADIHPVDMEAYLASQFSIKQILSEMEEPNSTFLLAYEGDQAIGYAKLKAGLIPGDEDNPSSIELERIYLESQAIGKGYGSALLRACLNESRARGFETIWLGVWEHNQRAIGFYEKWGFEIIASKDFFMGEERHRDLIMTRAL
jgi:ribosomal protein S18 acetylase RimI-like enzyme